MKNGRGQSIKWCEIEKEVTQRIKRQHATHCCKRKYDAMRKDWCAWKHLKTTETGLGWNPISGKTDASHEWWDKKMKVSFFLKNKNLVILVYCSTYMEALMQQEKMFMYPL